MNFSSPIKRAAHKNDFAPADLQIPNQLIEDLKLIYQLKPILEEREWKMKECEAIA